MDILNLIQDVTGNAGVVLAILGLVEWQRRLGVKGAALNVASMVTGFVLGGGTILTRGFPVDFAGWFYVVLAGIVFGLIASGIVDLTGRLVTTAVADVAVAAKEITPAQAEAVSENPLVP